MRTFGIRYLKNRFSFLWMSLFLLLIVCQTSLFAGIKPGEYDVEIKADKVELGDDTWVFSNNRKFTSEELGVETKWKNTGNNKFKIETDKSEIKKAIEKSFKLMGMKSSDFSISISKVEISGTTNGSKIKGDIKLDFRISITKPVKTSFSTRGSMSFKGKRVR